MAVWSTAITAGVFHVKHPVFLPYPFHVKRPSSTIYRIALHVKRHPSDHLRARSVRSANRLRRSRGRSPRAFLATSPLTTNRHSSGLMTRPLSSFG